MSIFVSSIAITRNIAPLTAIRKDPRSEKYVSDFLDKNGIRIVCGGTTSQIVARYLNEEVKVDVNYGESEAAVHR